MTESSTRDLGTLSHLDALLATVGPVRRLRILDIGCGEDTWRAPGRAGRPRHRLRSVHCRDAADRAGRRQLPSRQRHGRRLPEPDHEADLVLFVFSLHHVPGAKLERALAEARRVLRPSGRLYVAEPLAQGPHQYIIELFHDETAVRKAPPRPRPVCASAVRHRPHRDLCREAQLCRFRLVCRAHDRQHALQRLQRGSRAGACGAPPLRETHAAHGGRFDQPSASIASVRPCEPPRGATTIREYVIPGSRPAARPE